MNEEVGDIRLYALKRLGLQDLTESHEFYNELNGFVVSVMKLEERKRADATKDVRGRCNVAITRIIIAKGWFSAAMTMGG